MARFLDLSESESWWSWQFQTGTGATDSGSVKLEILADCACWIWNPPLADTEMTATAQGALWLCPVAIHCWHDFKLDWPPSQPHCWLPLPRLPLQSPYYADLLHLLQELTQPRFAQVVCHWPSWPIPVRAGVAQSGTVDLALCLHEAVDIWNDTAPMPLFRWAPDASWGVRLVHFPGSVRSPPLSAKVVRLDGTDGVLSIHILAGDTYDDVHKRRGAVRGLAHELGHALLLWGHSEDRRHLLWRSGPITDIPTSDEQQAAILLSLLPGGLQLSRYGRSLEVDPPWHQGHGAAIE
ncbi:MAG: hypothetical protein ABIF77_04885 [bacterium]